MTKFIWVSYTAKNLYSFVGAHNSHHLTIPAGEHKIHIKNFSGPHKNSTAC